MNKIKKINVDGVEYGIGEDSLVVELDIEDSDYVDESSALYQIARRIELDLGDNDPDKLYIGHYELGGEVIKFIAYKDYHNGGITIHDISDHKLYYVEYDLESDDFIINKKKTYAFVESIPAYKTISATFELESPDENTVYTTFRFINEGIIDVSRPFKVIIELTNDNIVEMLCNTYNYRSVIVDGEVIGSYGGHTLYNNDQCSVLLETTESLHIKSVKIIGYAFDKLSTLNYYSEE